MLRKDSWKIEILAFALLNLGIIYLMRRALAYGLTTFAHDNAHWNFPVFHFLTTRIINGELPLWNPFAHGGEPFYPLLFQIRLLEPFTLFFIGLGSRFTTDSLLLFHWHRYALLWVNLAGIYFWLRPYASSVALRLALMGILGLSSFFLGSLQQDGIINTFLWVPWLTFALREAIRVERPRKRIFVWIGLFLGWSYQSYFFSGIFAWAAFLLVGAFLFERKLVQERLHSPQWRRGIGLIILCLIPLSFPNWALFSVRDRFVYPLRMAPANYEHLESVGGPLPTEGSPNDLSFDSRLPYSFVLHTGGATQSWDFLQLLSANGNGAVHADQERQWGNPSDTFLFFGSLPWILALWGASRRRRYPGERALLFATIAMGLLALGPAGGIHRLLYPIFPPLWFIRNVGLFSHFFLMGSLYFFVMGANEWKRRRFSLPRGTRPRFAFQYVVLCFSLLVTFLLIAHSPRALMPWMGGILMGNGILFLSLSSGRQPLRNFAITLLVTQMILLGWFSPDAATELSKIALQLVGLWLLNRFRRQWVPAYLMLVVIAELVPFFRSARPLYDIQLSPSETLSTSLNKPFPSAPLPRKPGPHVWQGYYRSGPRYTSLITQMPAAFSLRYPHSEEKTDDFTEFHQSLRWNSFLLTRPYFELIHSKTPDSTLKKLFAIDQSPLSFSGETRVESYTANQLKLTVKSKGEPLVWHEGFDPDWSVTIDGKPHPIHWENAMTRVVNIPPGTHVVEFRFIPRRILQAFLIFWTASAVLLLGLVLACGKGKLLQAFQRIAFDRRKFLAPATS